MKSPDPVFRIADKYVGERQPVYFIADIAANHDGDLERAKDLIHMAAEAGADAAKFQHFRADTIVSDQGFRSLGRQQSHQAKWQKSVFEVYQDASVPLLWTQALEETCREAGIAFFTSPYDLDLVDHVEPYVPAFKIGSGDITWTEIIRHIAAKGKPTILATGASTMDDVQRAVEAALALTSQFALLQCNTNYTGDLENFRYIQLNVLQSYRAMYPRMVLGLSDHTPGHSTVLGAVALGAKVIEKHFTDDVKRTGPDHAFSMDPASWRAMVQATRELENALGTGVKRLEENEMETAVLQRRAVRVKDAMPSGAALRRAHLDVLRPCPPDAVPPWRIAELEGKVLRRDVPAGDYLRWTDFT